MLTHTSSPYLGQRVAHRREQLGLSQEEEELAARAKTTQHYINSIENDKLKPGSCMLFRIAAALGVPADELNRRERYLWNE